jgi:hypothetical protein
MRTTSSTSRRACDGERSGLSGACGRGGAGSWGLSVLEEIAGMNQHGGGETSLSARTPNRIGWTATWSWRELCIFARREGP